MIPKATIVIVLIGATFLGAGCTDPPPETAERSDTKTFELRAREDVEYKLFMREGHAIEYFWASGLPVVFDFHGDRHGDTSGDFTSHKEGTLATDAGDFKAPFTGRHGWYWRNENRQTVTITLETEGVYSIVGIV